MKKRIWRAGLVVWALLIGVAASPATSRAFELNGFGDVTFTNAERYLGTSANNGFALGQFDLAPRCIVPYRYRVLCHASSPAGSPPAASAGANNLQQTG